MVQDVVWAPIYHISNFVAGKLSVFLDYRGKTWSGQWYTLQNSKQGSWGRVPSPYFPAHIPTLFSTVARKTKDQILFFAFFKVLRLNPQVLSNLKLPADDSESGHEPKTKATAPL